ncbi:MAG: formate dehydrogenase accessory sulfurtransferase FdhD [Erythrobacter sp.]|jgi:FdhD protein
MADAVREVFATGATGDAAREWVPEEPVALEYNGLSYAVMMATPEHLEEFSLGFAITEGLARDGCDILMTDIAETASGWIVRTQLRGLGVERLHERIRHRVAESSCGLCGIENLEALVKPLPAVASHAKPERAAVFAAADSIRRMQALNHRTGAAHCAAFVETDGTIAMVREDVGRHNALDKLVGAMALAHRALDEGMILSSARCSYEIVEKAVRAGATRLVTISLPTSMAVQRARAAGLSLICLARGDSYLEVC